MDGTVRLWEVQSRRLIATLQGHTSGVRGVAMSADGHLVVSGSEDGTVRLWSFDTTTPNRSGAARPLATLEGHTGCVWSVALAQDGRTLASISEDGTVRVWDLASGQVLASLPGHTASWGVALSRDRILASAWGTRFVGEPKTVDVHVAWLRPKLEGSQVRVTTLRGIGYRLDVLQEKKPSVLFVCVHNAGRSQMAAAFLNQLSEGRVVGQSAGTRPASRIHSEVIEVMREVGIDLSKVQPRALTPELGASATTVITMGCAAEDCPVFAAPVQDWDLQDPAGLPLPEVRVIRDEIESPSCISPPPGLVRNPSLSAAIGPERRTFDFPDLTGSALLTSVKFGGGGLSM